MRFWERMQFMLRADAHGVLDGLQDRRLLLKQHLRDAELALVNKHNRLKELELEQRHLLEQQQQLAAEQALLERDITLALQSGQDELAKKPLERLLGSQQLSTRIAAQQKQRTAERTELHAAVVEQQAEFVLLQGRAREFLQCAQSSDKDLWASPVVSADQVELALLRRKQALREHTPRPGEKIDPTGTDEEAER